jgi:hypothetical protein
LWESRPEVSDATSTGVGAMIWSKTSCEVAADTKEKEDPEAALRSPATSSTMAAPEASAGASARETSLAADDDTLQERDRNSSGSRNGSGGRSGRSPLPPPPGLLALAAPVSVMVGAWTVACSACAWGLQRAGGCGGERGNGPGCGGTLRGDARGLRRLGALGLGEELG